MFILCSQALQGGGGAPECPVWFVWDSESSWPGWEYNAGRALINNKKMRDFFKSFIDGANIE